MAGVRRPELLTLRGSGARAPPAARPPPAGGASGGARRYLRVFQGALGLLAAARRRRPTEVWFGDSHAIFLNQDYTSAKLSRAPEGQIVWHLGGRLMWSLAHNGFPPRGHRVARVLRRIGRAGSVVPVFVAGEIDVRCHLVPRSTQPGYSLDFVADYVRRAQALATEMGAPSLIITVPVPPSDDCPRNPEFPIKGTIGERVQVFRELRRALIQAVADSGNGPEIRLVDATELLADDSGELRSELTDDGCHTNAKGVRLVRTT